jgi:glycosyltransferase involved in cell wall biosynthesis
MTLYVDISNYIDTRSHTGIQRVVREVILRLLGSNHKFTIKILYFNVEKQEFIALCQDEVKSFFDNTKVYQFSDLSHNININDISKEDIFLDMDGVWNVRLKRLYLYKILKINGAKIVNFIYDLVPILLPKYSHADTVRNFTMYIYSVFQYSDLVIFDSRSAEKDFLKVKSMVGNTRDISTRVAKLGSDIYIDKINVIESKYKSIFYKKYLLFVGTLEPRKNQKLMLDVFEKINKRYKDINLVFIGREGWNNDDLIHKIKNHPLLDKSLYWFNDISDDELVEFYKHAYINIYLSEYEGFGLPISESLSYGNITITSKNSSMYEVGKNFADYLIYNSFNELYELLELYIVDDKLYDNKKRYISKKYKPYSWDLTYNSIVTIFDNINSNIKVTAPKTMQFIFISIDFENMVDTIKEIDRHIDFVKEYIIVTRKDMINQFKSLSSKHHITIVDENEILKEFSKEFSKRDHQSKNWLLRASLLNLDNLDDTFIMLDDDNRPLKKIEIDHFIKDGKYNAYYYYDLLDWNCFQTEYDLGQHNTKVVLDIDGYELLSYSSHKPQIIDKKIFKKVIEKYFEMGLNQAIDEWSIYFNYAISNYPHLFNKIKYDTLNWPAQPSNWKQVYIPSEYNFENFYKSNFMGTLDEKISQKEKELSPYINNTLLEKLSLKDYKKYNMVHGILKFKHNKKSLYLLNLPYFIRATKGSWIKLSLNYKAINLQEDKVELFYTINMSKGTFSPVYINNNFEDNVLEFNISCESLQIGEYELLIDLYINNKSVYDGNSPYLVKLFVE